MRADGPRLSAANRLLAQDRSTSTATIAAEVGVIGAPCTAAFVCRDALLAAEFRTKPDAVDEVFDHARLENAPVAVALHR